jgi:hypothetical protein
MTTRNEDLWPNLELGSTVTPLSILREQAGLLTQRTKGRLRGEVETWTGGEQVIFAFNIVVPSLGGYKYTLLMMHYFPRQPKGYPVFVDSAPKIVFPQGPPVEMPSVARRIENENEFRNWLRLTFGSDEVKRIVESLYDQASA